MKSGKWPKCSVVITCFNYGQFVGNALQSALSQSFTDIEIIVVDDGSTDNSDSVIRSYVSDERVRYIRQANSGQPKAKNAGIRQCTGEFIAFLDADDIWLATKLEKQLALFENPETGVVYSRRKWIDREGNEIPGNERTLRRGSILNHIFIDNFICFSSSVVRRDLLQDSGCFDESLPMGIDYDLWLRLAARCVFDYVDEPLVMYRTGHANLSRNVLKRYDCAERIMNKALADAEIRRKLAWHIPRIAWADTWSNKAGYLIRDGKVAEGIGLFGRAICAFPLYLPLWMRLAHAMVAMVRKY